MYVHAHDAVVTVPLGFALPQPTFVPSMRHTFVYVTMLQCYNIVTFATSFFCHRRHLITPKQSLGLKFRPWIQKTRIIYISLTNNNDNN